MEYLLFWILLWSILGLWSTYIAYLLGYSSLVLFIFFITGPVFLVVSLFLKGSEVKEDLFIFYERHLQRGFFLTPEYFFPGREYINWCYKELSEFPYKEEANELDELKDFLEYKIEAHNKNPWVNFSYTLLITFLVSFSVMTVTLLAIPYNDYSKELDQVEQKSNFEVKEIWARYIASEEAFNEVVTATLYIIILSFMLLGLFSMKYSRLLAINQAIKRLEIDIEGRVKERG